MKITAGLSALCLALGLAAGVQADPRVDQANEVREEIATRQIPTCHVDYGWRDPCGHQVTCEKTLEAIADFQIGLVDPSLHKDAVYRWWRYLSGSVSKAGCARTLLSTNTYCKTVRLVKAFDPHTRCPPDGGTNATCWVNPSYETSPLLNEGGQDWHQDCRLSE